MGKRCCFIGHGFVEFSEDIRSKAIRIIEKLIREEDVTEFWANDLNVFEFFTTNMLLSLKEKYPHIKIKLVVQHISRTIRENREYFDARYDEIEAVRMEDIIKLNEYILDNSDFLVCFIKYEGEREYKLFEYAQRKKDVEIFNLAK